MASHKEIYSYKPRKRNLIWAIYQNSMKHKSRYSSDIPFSSQRLCVSSGVSCSGSVSIRWVSTANKK
jgi:hypothetical protein